MNKNIKDKELFLLRQLKESNRTDSEAFYDLCSLYSSEGMYERIDALLNEMFENEENSHRRADVLFGLGCDMEKRMDYATAVHFYRASRTAEPKNPIIRYFVNNNLGFSLNQLGRFDEAVPVLEEAINISPYQSNAFKNLGLAYQGLGNYEKAVECFYAATKANAADGRSIRHLEELVKEHPELYKTIPTLESILDGCQRAVAYVREHRPDTQ